MKLFQEFNDKARYIIYTFALLAGCIDSIAQLPSYLPTNGLVAWYPFNGNANDESGNGNHGTIQGNCSLVGDRLGNSNAAYFFDGYGDFIDVPDILENDFSVVITMRVSNFMCCYNGQVGGAIFSNFTNDLGFPGPNGLELGFSASNEFSLGNGLSGASFNTQIELSTWYHVGVTKQGNNVKMFINGVLVNETNDWISSSIGSTITRFGGRGNINPLFLEFNGILDDISVFNRALSALEVNNLFTGNDVSGSNGNSGNTNGTYQNTSPPGIPYQAEVRNESGAVLANANVNVRFTLHELTANGTVSYQETHALATNELGLFASTIGAGSATQGTFASINWAQTTKFLQVEMNAGNGWITMGNQQLMSVPYALYAANGPVGPQGEMGPQGSAGTPGVSGLNSLIQTTSVIPGANCSNGGVKIETGLDLNSNNVLEENEINHAMTKYVCNANDLSSNGISYTRVEYFMDPGTFNWQVPAGVTKIWVKCLGGGGAGGNGVNCMGGGGGSGGYAEGLVNVTPMMNLTINVGQGGAAGSIPTNGGNSSVGNLIVGGGGQAGGNGSTINGGAGGIGGISSGINCFLLNGSPGSSNCNSSLPGIPKITIPFPSIQFENSKVYGIGGQSTYNNIGFSGRSGFVVISY